MAADDPAFPQSLHSYGPFGGLTKREWFAGMALQGLYANRSVSLLPEEYASEAFAAADAMLAASKDDNA